MHILKIQLNSFIVFHFCWRFAANLKFLFNATHKLWMKV